jgi:hypothetical protein
MSTARRTRKARVKPMSAPFKLEEYRRRERERGQVIDWPGNSAPPRETLLGVSAGMLELLASRDASRLQRWVPGAARRLAAMLREIRQQWEDGTVKTVDEYLGWRRPRKWDRLAARRRARYKFRAYTEVVNKINAGKNKLEAFSEVAKMRKFPVSAQTVRDWYYELESELWLTDRRRRGGAEK